MRLVRYLARAGFASRRRAADLLAAGRVAVDGRPAAGPGDRVEPGRHRVTVDGRVAALGPVAWIALHKPPGYIVARGTARATRHPSAYTLVPEVPALVAVGRLDVMSEGLLLFSTDGDAVHRLMHPRWSVPRTYHLEVTAADRRALAGALDRGVAIEDGPPVRPERWRYRPARSGGELVLTLREGRNRVVRRLASALGLGVRRLCRVRYGPVRLGALAPGAWRPLEASEVRALYRSVSLEPPPPSRRWRP